METHDGASYQPQAEMQYNGLGQRRSLTAHQGGQSLTTQYVLDGDTLLAATASGQTTYYLSGIGEYQAAWGNYLADGTNSVRQTTNAQGVVTLTRSFTPWGELLALSGTGDFTWGYLGGVLDAATGLVYVGNGQYCDPATGRFLSRGVNPGAPNPYVPWQVNPTGMIVGPLALLALIRGKRKAEKIDRFMVVVIVALAVSLTISSCTGGGNGGTPTQPPSTPRTTPTGTPEPKPTSTPTNQPTGTGTPTESPKPPTPCPPTGTPTPFSWQSIGIFNMSAYYITHETQYYFGEGSGSRPIPSLDNISANKYFLFSKEGVCMQGTGRLKDGRLIGCTTQVNWSETETINNKYGNWLYTMPPDEPNARDNIPFFFRREGEINIVEAFETVAVCNPGKIPIDKGEKVEVRIKGIKDLVQKYSPSSDDIFRATYTGGALCPNTIDLFIGEEPAHPKFDTVKLQIFPDVMNLPDLEVEMRDMR